MAFSIGQKVMIRDLDKVKNDPYLEENALNVISKSEFSGEVTKIEDGIHFVGFKNDTGWVTQGFKEDEIKEAK